MVDLFSEKRGTFYFKLFIIFFITVIISFGAYFYFANSNRNAISSLKINVILEDDSLYNDEFLKFSTELYSNKKCKGLVSYEIFNLNDLSAINNKRENIEFVEKSTRNDQISLNNLEKGDYILRGQIKCDTMGDVFTAKFKIIPKQILNISNAKKIETLQNISNMTSPQAAEAPATRETELKISDIIEMSKTNLIKAEQLCNSFKTDNDKCFAGIAIKTKNKIYCSKVEEVSLRDGCYANLALIGDYSVCDSIYDYYQKQGCYALKSNIAS